MTLEKNAGETYVSAGEIEALVRAFEDCTLAPSRFHHREHLIVAFWYLNQTQTIESASTRLRASILRFLAHHAENLQIYNETITLFWLRRVRAFLERQDAARSPFESVREMFASCGASNAIYSYYSKEILATDEARTGWVEPDLRALDF